MPHFVIKYQLGTYSGKIGVNADDAEEAVAKAKRELKKLTSMPMYYESYKVVESWPIGE